MHAIIILVSILVIIVSIISLTKKSDYPRTGEKILSYLALGLSTLLMVYYSFEMYKKSAQINQIEELLQF